MLTITKAGYGENKTVSWFIKMVLLSTSNTGDRKLVSSRRRNETAFAISSGLPILPNGMVLRRLFFNCSPLSPSTMLLVIGVSIGPGLIAGNRLLIYLS